MKRKGFFLTFEGTDGAGKSTQAKLLKEWLQRKKWKVRLTREPGGGPEAERIRAEVLDPENKMDSLAELFLYEAARASHVEEIIRPALKKGEVVLCDRFTDATVAYQGFGRGVDLDVINRLNEVATNGLKPHLTILLDLPAEAGFKKAETRRKNKKADRLEKEGVNFQKKVRQGYLAQAKKEPRRVVRVAVQDSVMATQDKIRTLVEARLG